jgi:hypothetical protein
VVYIKRDLKKFGALDYLSHYPVNQESASYFMFDEDMQISSIEMLESEETESVLI